MLQTAVNKSVRNYQVSPYLNSGMYHLLNLIIISLYIYTLLSWVQPGVAFTLKFSGPWTSVGFLHCHFSHHKRWLSEAMIVKKTMSLMMLNVLTETRHRQTMLSQTWSLVWETGQVWGLGYHITISLKYMYVYFKHLFSLLWKILNYLLFNTELTTMMIIIYFCKYSLLEW